MARSKQSQSYEIDDRRFRALIEKSWDVVVLVDAKTRVLFATPSIVRLFGREMDEFVGLRGVQFVHPLDIPHLLKSLSQLLLKPRGTVVIEIRIKHKEGYYRWIEAIATNLLSDPEIKAIVVNFHDITERKELEQQKSDFINIASHELKTPITSLKAYSQILGSRITDLSEEEAREVVKRISYQIDRLSRLVTELLDTTKIQEGKLALQKERFNLNTLMKDVLNDIEVGVGTHKVVVDSSFNGHIYADKYRINQVLVNLLTNAMKFSPKKDTVTIRVRRGSKNITIAVRDYGVGISKEDQKKIFQRFFQAKSGQEGGGLGLGLFITASIIKQHGGVLRVKSRKGYGSTFTFTLPRSKRK